MIYVSSGWVNGYSVGWIRVKDVVECIILEKYFVSWEGDDDGIDDGGCVNDEVIGWVGAVDSFIWCEDKGFVVDWAIKGRRGI